MNNNFKYSSAFSRNLGWITESEAQTLKKIRVGILGLGGVGGVYSEVLARLGVCHFVISDPDIFSIENTNRQNECRVSNYNKNKAEVICNLIKDINPEASVKIISGGIKDSQVQEFVDDIDIYFDGLDFFSLDIRRKVINTVIAAKKFSITTAPVGTGASTVIFSGDSMSFDQYFGYHENMEPTEKAVRFLLGLAPSLQHVSYVVDRSKANMEEQRLPSLPMGVYSAAAASATQFLKIVLKRGRVPLAPWCFHYDPYLLKLKKNYLIFGSQNPIQMIKLLILKNMLKK